MADHPPTLFTSDQFRIAVAKNCAFRFFSLTLEPVPDFIMPAVSKKTPSNRPLRSGELARLSGVSADTLRHYERKGLLKPHRASNGYREYTRQAVERVRLIRGALAIGF